MNQTNQTNQTDNASQKSPIAISGQGLQITSLDEAWRMAKFVLASGFAPREFDTAEKILIAMEYGWELGLRPMQALRTIAVINGRPSLWGDSLPALVQRSRMCEYVREHFEGEPFEDNYTAVCESKRRDQASPVIRKFSVADAKRAKLWGKVGPKGPTPWVTYPQRMLALRARAWNFRDNFADALGGLSVAEEAMDIPSEETEQLAPLTEEREPEKEDEVDALVAGSPVPETNMRLDISATNKDIHSAIIKHIREVEDTDELNMIWSAADECARGGSWTLRDMFLVKNEIVLRRIELNKKSIDKPVEIAEAPEPEKEDEVDALLEGRVIPE